MYMSSSYSIVLYLVSRRFNSFSLNKKYRTISRYWLVSTCFACTLQPYWTTLMKSAVNIFVGLPLKIRSIRCQISWLSYSTCFFGGEYGFSRVERRTNRRRINYQRSCFTEWWRYLFEYRSHEPYRGVWKLKWSFLVPSDRVVSSPSS